MLRAGAGTAAEASVPIRTNTPHGGPARSSFVSMADDTIGASYPATVPAALAETLEKLDLREGLLRELQCYPEEAGTILVETAEHLLHEGEREQGLRLLEALRDHPPAPEDAQYALIEIARDLREQGRGTESERMVEDLLRTGGLQPGPAGLLADLFEGDGDPVRALHCYNIAARELLAHPDESLAGASVYDIGPLVGRARLRGEAGLEPDGHDLVALEAAGRFWSERQGEAWPPPGPGA